jgi:hypothetical protein
MQEMRHKIRIFANIWEHMEISVPLLEKLANLHKAEGIFAAECAKFEIMF